VFVCVVTGQFRLAVVRGMTMALFLGVNVVVSADEMELVKLFLSFFCNWFSIK